MAKSETFTCGQTLYQIGRMQLLNLLGRIDLAVSELQRQQTALETLMIWGLESWKMRTSRRQTIRQLEHPESPVGTSRVPSWRIEESPAGGLRTPQLEDCGVPSWRIADSPAGRLRTPQLGDCGVHRCMADGFLAGALRSPQGKGCGLPSWRIADSPCGLPSWRIAESAGVWLTASQLEHCGVPSWRTGRSPAGGTLQLGKGTTTTTTKGLNDRRLNNKETEEQTREEQKKKEKNNN